MDESDPHSSLPQKTVSNWDSLGQDLTELILACLPIPSVIQASAVCKLWNSVINSYSFKTRVSDSRRPPWLFLCGQNKSFLNRNQAFAFDPESDSWIKLPIIALLSKDLLAASNGFFFSTCPGKFSFKPVFNGMWRQTSTEMYKALADVQGCLAVEIYNSHRDSWELCPPLPEIFRPGNSSKLLCSSLFRGKLYVLSIYSGFISSFDLEERFWSNVQTLRPPGTLFSYLISCQDLLVLAGLCSINGDLEFNLWRIDEKTLEFSEIAIMPPDLLSMFIDSNENLKFTSLKCTGSRNFIYVFKEERPWDCPVCVCEMSKSGKCSWRRVPSLPEPRHEFEEVISFCSNVSFLDILGKGSD
ncbi:F-box/kelch-repeat protein [Sesamum angolense]|uniref:F-box/kelch-repeat protein n=1 Tax=Sesamum angolense TaxID=2727404 RepID=A0AAE1X8S8_9LAMI|nr:F-box/kelch-repeat protein [Sesamum angolense]